MDEERLGNAQKPTYKKVLIILKYRNMETTSMVCKVMSTMAVINGMGAVRANVIARRTHSNELGMVKSMMMLQIW